MKSTKSIIPLLLIVIYFIADEFFGAIIGSCTAFILGCIEFIYIRIQEKKYDKVVFFTTLLFCLPGILDVYSPYEIFKRLQPVIIETGICILISIYAFSKIDLSTALPSYWRQNFHPNPYQLYRMRNIFRLFFFLFVCHVLLSYISFFFFSNAVSDFISGPLLYIMIGVFFIGIILYNRIQYKKMHKEEWLPIVNEKGEVEGCAPRKKCHSGIKFLHPVVHLHIINGNGDVFLQKRSMKKDLLPGKWDTAVGGHVCAGESIENALKRETQEELGITNFQAIFIGKYIWESTQEKELVFSFICQKHTDICINNDEVDEGRFWNNSEILKGIQTGEITPNFAHEYQQLLYKQIMHHLS